MPMSQSPCQLHNVVLDYACDEAVCKDREWGDWQAEQEVRAEVDDESFDCRIHCPKPCVFGELFPLYDVKDNFELCYFGVQDTFPILESFPN